MELVELPEPKPRDGAAVGGREEAVAIDVRAAGVGFPDLLQSRGEYQFRPNLPFVPGAEVAGIVRSAPSASPHREGDRVVALTVLGGFAELALSAPRLTFALPDGVDFAAGAGLVFNYHTALYALRRRGRLRSGETALIHGAAGGVGTACIQVARGLGAETIAVTSSPEKAEVALRAGADHVLVGDSDWGEAARELTSGNGPEVVVDCVGGDRFDESVRCAATEGRILVLGFAAGRIPEVKLNRLLLRNVSVLGVGWGHFLLEHLEYGSEAAGVLETMVERGHVRPLIGRRYRLEEASQALEDLDCRRAVGKLVLEP